MVLLLSDRRRCFPPRATKVFNVGECVGVVTWQLAAHGENHGCTTLFVYFCVAEPLSWRGQSPCKNPKSYCCSLPRLAHPPRVQDNSRNQTINRMWRLNSQPLTGLV